MSKRHQVMCCDWLQVLVSAGTQTNAGAAEGAGGNTTVGLSTA